MRVTILAVLLGCSLSVTTLQACSVLYYIDKATGNIYVANHEDYWYDGTKAYIQIMPASGKEHARLWYGWDNFAQGGVNAAGLFFDGAVAPEETIPEGYHKPKGNLGDEILANCRTVDEALAWLEKKRVALTNAHMMFGDAEGNATVVEWVEGERKLTPLKDNYLVMTNFLLADPAKGNYPCYRHRLIEDNIKAFEQQNAEGSLLKVANFIANAAQAPTADESGKTGGTLYSSFIDITNMELVLMYKLDNSRVTRLDLKEEFATSKKRKINLQ